MRPSSPDLGTFRVMGIPSSWSQRAKADAESESAVLEELACYSRKTSIPRICRPLHAPSHGYWLTLMSRMTLSTSLSIDFPTPGYWIFMATDLPSGRTA